MKALLKNASPDAVPTFHRNRLQDYARQMVDCLKTLTSSWPSGKPADIAHEMNYLTLDIIGPTLLGISDKRVMIELGTHPHHALNLVNRFIASWADWLESLRFPSQFVTRMPPTVWMALFFIHLLFARLRISLVADSKNRPCRISAFATKYSLPDSL